MINRGKLFLVTAAALFLAAGCSGTAPPGSGCRATSDCRKGLDCAGPNEPNVCGISPREGCTTDADCSGGQVCHAIYDTCSPDAVGSECGPKCGACNPGFRCNAAGACEAQPCDEGFRCPAQQRCDAAAARAMPAVHQRTQGCFNITCTTDAGCPAGKFCVNAYCQDGPGTCKEPVAVP